MTEEKVCAFREIRELSVGLSGQFRQILKGSYMDCSVKFIFNSNILKNSGSNAFFTMENKP